MVSRQVDLGGPVHYADFGGSGPPLVLIHGLAVSHLTWLAVAPRLALRHRVYAIDFIGHGLTPLAGRKANLHGHRSLITRFLKEVVGQPAVLVGNSTGGHLALQVAVAQPERVSGVVLVDASVPVPMAGLRVMAHQIGVWGLLLPGLAEFALRAHSRRGARKVVEQVARACTPHPDRIPAEVVERMVRLQEQRSVREDARAVMMTLRSLWYWNFRRGPFRRTLAAVRAPALIVHGDRDPLVPPAAAHELHRRRPDWHLHVFQDCGHIPMLEQPAEFLEVVERWLESDVRGRGSDR